MRTDIVVLTTFLKPETFLEKSANNGSENILLVFDKAVLISGEPIQAKCVKSLFFPKIGKAMPKELFSYPNFFAIFIEKL